MKLTRGRAILVFVADYTAARGYPPSHSDIGAGVGLTSTSSVAYQLRALTRAGLLGPRTYDRRRALALAVGVAVSRNGLIARAVAVSHCPRCLLSLPEDHDCAQSRSKEIPNA